jgi:hypothetical protein
MEAAFITMAERHRAGAAPEHFAVRHGTGP